MKVVALQPGFYDGSLRAAGDEFDVDDKAKAEWFAPVDAAPKAKGKGKEAPAKQEPTTLSQLGNEPGKPMAEVLA